ncbi:hypothetical protein [Cytobacillus oceanisediminis]|uniref:Uncharacterized protein n=1 Tax=Cytobacillus oceanisediminis 2691 TaxID=1196031 RepID=A0A160MEB4_9BACI|nr:hypothetical protein [Cytobacillus oceanisediminis]AND41452.1 hypothetical protein A361_20565 [Cytobacillus oceanisediminis 2691]
MKIRTKKPYVYFFFEPNIVIAREIPNKPYGNLEEFCLCPKLHFTYELKGNEDFESFDHIKKKHLEGKGYIIDQESTLIMFKTMNRHSKGN